jgi:hypothetical protein
MGTGWESTPWHATQRAAWEALRKAEEGETPRPLDAKIFPDEWSQVRPPQNGMYVIFRSESQEIVYVGIAASVERRIYEHIGPGFSWARSGSQCDFPNMALAAQRPWLVAQTQDLLRRGDFRVQVIAVTPPECSALLEASARQKPALTSGRRPSFTKARAMRTR